MQTRGVASPVSLPTVQRCKVSAPIKPWHPRSVRAVIQRVQKCGDPETFPELHRSRGRTAPSVPNARAPEADPGAVGYARVSTLRQGTDGLSLETQLERIRAYCLARGWTLHETFTDTVSGTLEPGHKRPGLAAAVESAKKRRGRLVFYSLARVARRAEMQLRLHAHLAKRHVQLVSVTEAIDTTTAAGRLLFHMLAAAAEFQAASGREATIAVLGQMREAGLRVGAVPYGWREPTEAEYAAQRAAGKNGRAPLVPIPSEIAAIRMMLRLRYGGMGYHRIAQYLTKHGIPTKADRRAETAESILGQSVDVVG